MMPTLTEKRRAVAREGLRYKTRDGRGKFLSLGLPRGWSLEARQARLWYRQNMERNTKTAASGRTQCPASA